jgi:hypothetical protein
MSLDPFFDPAPPWRVRAVSTPLLALGLLLPVLAGCKKQAEAPPVTNEANCAPSPSRACSG